MVETAFKIKDGYENVLKRVISTGKAKIGLKVIIKDKNILKQYFKKNPIYI